MGRAPSGAEGPAWVRSPMGFNAPPGVASGPGPLAPPVDGVGPAVPPLSCQLLRLAGTVTVRATEPLCPESSVAVQVIV